MTRVIVKFNKSWPLAGQVRKAGEVLIEGASPISGVTAEKIINAFVNGVLSVEITGNIIQGKDDEKKVDSHGIGALFGKRSRKNKEP